jgi:hypothetical protein
VDPLDIFLWPDGFWCYREEFVPAMLRDENYRVIEAGFEEWFIVSRSPRGEVDPS